MSQEQPASFENSLQMVLEHWSAVEREREKNTFPLTDEDRRKTMTPEQMEDLMDSKNLASEHLDEMAEDSFLDMWREDVSNEVKSQIVEKLLGEDKKDILRFLYKSNDLSSMSEDIRRRVESLLGVEKK